MNTEQHYEVGLIKNGDGTYKEILVPVPVPVPVPVKAATKADVIANLKHIIDVYRESYAQIQILNSETCQDLERIWHRGSD